MANQRTLVLCKPDAVQRGLVGRILSRFEEKGLKIAGLKMLQVDEALAGRHYAEHLEKPFYPELLAFITASPVVALAIEGDNAVEVVRNLMGVTNPQKAGSGTIRGDFGLNLTMNLVHGSDSLASAQRELALFFEPEELFGYAMTLGVWT
ncbi:MAG: nucleoside-diphosphate kinase [Candidatus Bipolaricaulis sp.]|nr:nucleoside-diphosphate kinase [Candidatus Bipolaricaulis sp.]MDD5219880.1 nucleoside-diphosphate kinase [Candidatus Bipolaricaulis sp.]MDD5647164.1 nucleoside-diphosphate kinase [Candidatus Bipolaricaulis sp.]